MVKAPASRLQSLSTLSKPPVTTRPGLTGWKLAVYT